MCVHVRSGPQKCYLPTSYLNYSIRLFKPDRNEIYWPLIALKCSPWKDKIESPSLGALGYLKQSQYGIWKQDLSNCWKMHQISPCFTLNVKAWRKNRLNVRLSDLSYRVILLGCYNTYPSPQWPPSHIDVFWTNSSHKYFPLVWWRDYPQLTSVPSFNTFGRRVWKL